MANLCKLTDATTGRMIFVNPDQVRFVIGYDASTMVCFGGDHSISVKENVEAVVAAIENADRT